METPKSVLQYIELIDAKFLEAKKKRISRYDDEWGVWSRSMNLEIRRLLEAPGGDKMEKALLGCILPYWFATSELLELNFKSKVSGNGKKKKLLKEKSNLKNHILGGNPIPQMSIQDISKRTLEGI